MRLNKELRGADEASGGRAARKITWHQTASGRHRAQDQMAPADVPQSRIKPAFHELLKAVAAPDNSELTSELGKKSTCGQYR